MQIFNLLSPGLAVSTKMKFLLLIIFPFFILQMKIKLQTIKHRNGTQNITQNKQLTCGYITNISHNLFSKSHIM